VAPQFEAALAAIAHPAKEITAADGAAIAFAFDNLIWPTFDHLNWPTPGS
jgi:hypothetical protein